MEKKTFTFVFTEQELLILNSAIVEIPFKIAAPLIDSINKQIIEQENASDKK
jgi:hypothetical protein